MPIPAELRKAIEAAHEADETAKFNKYHASECTRTRKPEWSKKFEEVESKAAHERALIIQGLDKNILHIIKNNEDINGQDEKGLTALMLAAKHDAVDIIRILLNAGADPHLTDHEGLDALSYATINSPNLAQGPLSSRYSDEEFQRYECEWRSGKVPKPKSKLEAKKDNLVHPVAPNSAPQAMPPVSKPPLSQADVLKAVVGHQAKPPVFKKPVTTPQSAPEDKNTRVIGLVPL